MGRGKRKGVVVTGYGLNAIEATVVQFEILLYHQLS